MHLDFLLQSDDLIRLGPCCLLHKQLPIMPLQLQSSIIPSLLFLSFIDLQNTHGQDQALQNCFLNEPEELGVKNNPLWRDRLLHMRTRHMHSETEYVLLCILLGFLEGMFQGQFLSPLLRLAEACLDLILWLIWQVRARAHKGNRSMTKYTALSKKWC